MSDATASAPTFRTLPACALCVVLGLAGVSACTPVPVSPERAAELCEEQARAAQGPTGAVTVGANSNTGPSASIEIGVSSDFIRGSDPLDVYERCVFDKTGAGPIRPPVLR